MKNKTTLLQKAAVFLYKRACIRGVAPPMKRQVSDDLMQLHPGENLEWVKQEYYTKRLTLFLGIVFGGICLAALAGLKPEKVILSETGDYLQRGSPGETEQEVRLLTDYCGETMRFALKLAARQPGKEEAEQWMQELAEQLPALILAQNPSTWEITTNLALWEAYEAFPVTLEWSSDMPEVITDAGEVHPPDGQRTVILKAAMKCGDFCREEELTLTVLPEELSEEERVYRELQNYLTDAEESSRKGELQLPEEWNGEKLSWKLEKSNTVLFLLAGTAVTAILVCTCFDRDLHEKLAKRKKALLGAYAGLVYQLVLFIEAGMPTRAAFERMEADYAEKKRRGGKEDAAYEEIIRTNREMQAGVAEGAAYEHFGRRTGLQQYMRLCGLLTQNLKRGNSSLPERLREETYRAGEEKLQHSKKLGEEAGTKLLFPMVMMLSVVMLLIIVPAFSDI